MQDITKQQSAIASPLNDPRRKTEVQRLAQTAAAEYFGQNQFKNGNSAGLDTAQISREAIDEISGSAKPEEIQRTDQLVNALQGAFALKSEKDGLGNGNQDRAGASRPDANGAATEAEGQTEQPKAGKRKEKKETQVWEPTCEKGQLHEGRDVIGKITVKTEVTEVDTPSSGTRSGGTANRNGNVAATLSKATNGASAAGSFAPARGARDSAASKDSSAGKNDEESETGTGAKDKQAQSGGAMASTMQAKGLQAPGLDAKRGSSQDQAAGSKSEDFEVRTRATGATQTMSVQSAGELKGDSSDFLRYFKRLDDMPTLANTTLHSKSKGQDLDKTAQQYAGEALKNGESADHVQSTVKKLKENTVDG